MTLIVKDGLSDIENYSNKYGVARNIMKIIIEFIPTFRCIYDEVAFGRLPTKGCDTCNDHPMCMIPFIMAAAYGGHIHLMEYYIKIEPYYDMPYVLDMAVKGGHVKAVKYLQKESLYPNNKYDIYDAICTAYYHNTKHLIELFVINEADTIDITNVSQQDSNKVMNETNKVMNETPLMLTVDDVITFSKLRNKHELLNYITNKEAQEEVRKNKIPNINSIYICFTKAPPYLF